LEKEELNSDSSRDFGKDIIPAMINDQCHLHAYRFKGYWKDVGTVQSFWEANMDLLSENTNPIMQNEEWMVYTEATFQPPMYLDTRASLKQSIVSEGCKIYGKVENSILFTGVKIGKGAVVKDSVILPGTVIEANAVVNRVVVGCNTVIEANAVVGSSNLFSEITLIGNEQIIHEAEEAVKEEAV
jgi:glucose-1-phosphate adenylyltransferase